MPYGSRICSIFPLRMESMVSVKSTNRIVACRFFARMPSRILWIVNICEVVVLFLRKPICCQFWVLCGFVVGHCIFWLLWTLELASMHQYKYGKTTIKKDKERLITAVRNKIDNKRTNGTKTMKNEIRRKTIVWLFQMTNWRNLTWKKPRQG